MESQFNLLEENAVFLGNLRKDCPKKDLVNYLYELFSQTLGIYLRRSDIYVKGGSKSRHAFIHVQSKDDLQYAIDHLDTWEKRRNLRFGFSSLLEPKNALKVGIKRPDKSQNKNKSKKDKLKQNQVVPEPLNLNQSSYHTPPSVNNVNERRTLQSLNHGMHQKEGKFYIENENLGNETRNKEFKEGGGEHYIDKNLGDHVAKYICGFLNSSQAGTLFIGVKDNGNVIGIDCDHTLKKEDNIRLKIDQTIKSIQPQIFPQSYHVQFVPVCHRNGQAKGNFKVIEISVDKVDSQGLLYEAAGEVYIRRDGSVQGPLKPSGIQEWSKQFYKKELERQKRELDNHIEVEKYKVLKEKDMEIRKISEESQEKDKEIHKLQKQIDDVNDESQDKQKEEIFQEKDKEIQKLQKEIQHLKNNKSKLCVIQ